MSDHTAWPSLPYEEWVDTYDTLHLYTQVAGKIKLALSPFLNEWRHVALSIWARGITTGPIPYQGRIFELRFDLVSHNVEIFDSTGRTNTIELVPRPVAEFYKLVLSNVRSMGIEVTIAPEPQEIENAIPLETDTVHHSYDREAVGRFWTILASISGVFESFRSGFSGKASSVLFWWGSFDLAVSRFSGNPCASPPHASRMARIDCNEEHFAAGFWPGSGKLLKPAFYAYGYPAAPGIEQTAILPKQAYWNADLGEFILHYDDVQASATPEAMILDFLKSTYERVANSLNWDREFLERKIE